MSCGCNQTPCSCSPQPPICCNPTVESITYSFENANLVGIGFLEGVTDTLVQFRGIVSESPALILTLDTDTNAIVIDFNGDLLIGDIPDATTTQRGMLETATNGEAVAKAANNKIVVPSNFAAMAATETFAGFAEIATQAETNSGVNDLAFVTPLKLGTWWTAKLASDVTFGSNITVGGNVTAGGLLSDELTVAGGDFAVTTAAFFFLPITFESGSVFQLAGVPMADQFLLGGSSGEPTGMDLHDVLTAANTVTYGLPSGTLARTTFASYAGQSISNPPTQAEVQAIDNALVIVSQRLAALITDIMATNKPHA